MAKYFGFINGEGQTIDYMASSDTEKAVIQANLTPREIDWVSVSDEDYAKGHFNTHEGVLSNGAVNWTVEHDGTFESSQEVVQSQIDFNINEINRWLNSTRCSDATQKTSWEAYRDTLSALDLSSTTTTFPITGTCALKTLVDNGDLAEYRHTQRLP